jgi:hypothetical protein
MFSMIFKPFLQLSQKIVSTYKKETHKEEKLQ